MNVAVPWMAELVLISWRSFKAKNRPPLPSEVLATFVVFGTFSLIPDPKISTLMGWGIVLATALNVLPNTVAPNYGTGGVNLTDKTVGIQRGGGTTGFSAGGRFPTNTTR